MMTATELLLARGYIRTVGKNINVFDALICKTF